MVWTIVDLIGKLGPLAVAFAVYYANKKQTAWANLVAGRAADVEDQKVRLSLLDRRVIAVDAILSAHQDFMTSGHVSSTVVERVYDALKVAQMVFDSAVEEQAIACMRSLHDWQRHDRARARWRDTDDGQLAKAVTAMEAAEAQIIGQLEWLRETMIAKTRIVLPSSLASYVEARDSLRPTGWRKWLPRSLRHVW